MKYYFKYAGYLPGSKVPEYIIGECDNLQLAKDIYECRYGTFMYVSVSEEEPKEPHAILSKFKQKDKSSKEMLKLNMNLVIFERKLGHVASRTESNSFKHEMFDITKLGYK